MKRQGLVVPPDILAERIRMGRRQKGDIPHNKGKKMPPEVYEKVKATMFQAKHKPHNTRFDGAETFRHHRSGAYWYMRTEEGKWRLKHRLLWEEANGPVPPRHNIVFRDGDVNNITLENLELVTNAELMRRNSGVINMPDKYIARILAGKFQKHLKQEFEQMPELIELKRNSIKLKKELRNANAK
jgi:hypothetical protein